jgi:hypothetical protein
LLNERVARVIQNGLRHSGPATSFSMAVIAGLPALAAATTAKGTVVGMATTQGGKAAGFAGALKSVGLFAGLVAIPALIGSLIGQKLGGDSAGTGQRRKAAAQFWRLFIRGMVVLLFVPLVLTFGLTGFFHDEARVKFLAVMTAWLGLAYPFVLVALVYWGWQRRRKNAETAESDDDSQTNELWPIGFVVRNGRRVILLLTIAAGALLVFCYFDMRHDLRRVDAREVKDIIEKNDPQNLRVHISVSHYRSLWEESPDTYRTFLVRLTKDGQKTTYLAPVSEEAVSLLARKGIACPIYVQGRDFEVLGTPGRHLPFLTAFVLAIGAIFILKQRQYARMTAR